VGNISVDYDVLNQKGSPAWYSDLFANIPTPGYKGRMFISTDTFAFYRDNGVGWDLVGGPGTGTITGAGVSGQLTYFIGTDVISGNNNLFYDITNGRLGINTTTPGSPLDIHSTGTAAQFNGTGVNNAFVLFQNAGTSKWRIGNLYNSGANDYQIYDVLNATARLTIKNTGATTLTGTFTATSLIKSGGTSSQILLADGTTTPTSTFGAGSVTNVSALTLGTSGVDLSSSVANSTTTPVITLNVPTASALNRGALSSADWTTFNNKQATLSLTTTGTSGAATLVGATLNIPNYTNVGTVTSVAALTLGTSGTDLSSSVANSTSTPVITLNVPTASATNRGALSSADFTTFNNKQATISVTAPVVLTGATISMPAATTSVNGYLTSIDWNTFNNKTSNLGTVTDVVALTIGTSGIDITSTAVTTTTTPIITLNIPTASASNRGALSSTDWTTFNNKQATLSLTTTGTSGVATLVANTLNVPNYGSGAVTGSGTTNYLPKFTGASTIGNSLVFDNGTSVVIGTNTPATNYILTLRTQSADYTKVLDWGTAAGGSWGNITINTSSPYQTILNSSAWQFNISGTQKMLLDSTGNLGLGITPSAWASFVKATQIGTTTAIWDYLSVNSYFTNNVFIDSTGNTKYITTAQVSLLGLYNGGFDFSTAASGTAGTTATLVNRMTITNAGNVGIGIATPGAKLQVKTTTSAGGTDAFYIENSSAALFEVRDDGLTYMKGNVGIGVMPTTTIFQVQGSINNNLAFFNNTASNGYATARFFNDTSKEAVFGVGGSASGSPYANNGYIYTGASTDFVFAVATTEKYRITSAGINNYTSRGNYLGATDNALFSLNSGGTLYTVGFSPTATASSTNTLTLTTGTTTWIYTGTGTATWTLPNPSGNNQIYWIKNAGTGIITLNAFSGTNIINNAAASVGSITIAVGATAVIAQDGNVKSYQLQ